MSSEYENPFPAMNPWLEGHWHSVHAAFLTYVRDQISDQLPPGLAALTEERVEVEDLTGGGKKRVGQDVSVHDVTGDTGGTATLAEPRVFDEPDVGILEDKVERSIHIVSGSGELITSIEILSPSNTVGVGRDRYLSKQNSLQMGGINLVEIDLIRDHSHVLIGGPGNFDPLDPYRVSIWRACRNDRVQTYSISYTQRLPRIIIPLREQDADAVVDLQEVIDEVYRKGRYTYLIDYRIRPKPSIDNPDAVEWFNELLREKELV